MSNIEHFNPEDHFNHDGLPSEVLSFFEGHFNEYVKKHGREPLNSGEFEEYFKERSASTGDDGPGELRSKTFLAYKLKKGIDEV